MLPAVPSPWLFSQTTRPEVEQLAAPADLRAAASPPDAAIPPQSETAITTRNRRRQSRKARQAGRAPGDVVQARRYKRGLLQSLPTGRSYLRHPATSEVLNP